MEDLICKFSKKGLTPSQIGVLLRDNHGIAQVSTVTGSKVLRILKGAGASLAAAPRCCEASPAGRRQLVRGSRALTCGGQGWRRRFRRTSTTSSRRR